MSVIRIGGFRGELPRIHPRLLPSGSAQSALNCRMDSGALESVRDTSNIQSTTLSSPISLHRYSASIWLEAITDTDWVTYPVANDAFGRLIYADPSASEIRVTDASLVGAGGTPAGYYRLDVPAPVQGFSVAVTGTADDEDEVPETRYYVCTFVNSWGAEGPPSPASNQVEWRTGQTVTLTSLPAVPSGSYNITHRRIYRLNTGSSGVTNYQFVTEIAVAQVQTAITAITQANPIVVTAAAHGLLEGQETTFSGLGGEATQTIVGITKANPARVTVVGHGYATGDYVELTDLGGVNGMDELDDVRAQITLVNDDNFDLDGVDSSAYVTWSTGGLAAKTHGMDELNGNTYFISVVDVDNVLLVGVDGSGYKVYYDSGLISQIAGVTYIDTVASAALAEVIPTETYDPPNSATIGLTLHPAGFLVGFYGNTLTFSEPGAPHAWPIEYRLVTNHDIVSVGVFGNTTAVMTQGWPYLVLGSDPAALSMVELEVEQACSSKRGVVDLGSAIVYPSPDGLILLSTNGVSNVSSGIFNRDQWQALVPSSFEAYNWEQQYLCFYDDGSGTQRGFIIDPFDPAAGVRYVAKFTTGGYKDIEEDLLYFIITDEIETWDQGAELNYNWKSSPTYTPHAVNMACAKIIADTYPVTVNFYVDDIRRYSRVVTSLEAFRLPGGFRGEKFEVTILGNNKVSEVAMATTMIELSVTV